MMITVESTPERPVAGVTILAVLVLALVIPSALFAGSPTSLLIRQDLPDLPGKVATVLTVQYAPGTASDAHQHPGSVFAYVLEGAVVSQLEGEKPVTYTAGQSWYEPPGQAHVVLRNASREETAKILVFILTQEGEELKSPVKLSDVGK